MEALQLRFSQERAELQTAIAAKTAAIEQAQHVSYGSVYLAFVLVGSAAKECRAVVLWLPCESM